MILVIATGPADNRQDAAWARLEDQIGYYDRSSQRCQRHYKWLKGAEVTAAAAIPIVAGFRTVWWIAAVLGSFVVVLEGIQHLNQYNHNWITYRSTCEALRHEKHLFLARAGPYAGIPDPSRLLAERVEELVSTEHAKWIGAHSQARGQVRTN